MTFIIAVLVAAAMVVALACYLLYYRQPKKETFVEPIPSDQCYDVRVVDELYDVVVRNNGEIEKQSGALRSFYDTFYSSDHVDKIVGSARGEVDSYHDQVRHNIKKVKEQLGGYVTNEYAQNFVKKDDFALQLLPLLKQPQIDLAFEQQLHSLDTLFYKADRATTEFVTQEQYAAYEGKVQDVDAKFGTVQQQLAQLRLLLDTLERKENIEGAYVEVDEFNRMTERVNEYRKKIEAVEEAIRDSMNVYNASKKTMDARFQEVTQRINDINTQQGNIRTFLTSQYDKDTEQKFVFQHDFQRLDGDVNVLEEQVAVADRRLDNFETKLLAMNAEMCVGGECMQYGDFKDLKSLAQLFRSNYKKEREMVGDLQTEMIEDERQLIELQGKLAKEVATREELTARHDAEVEAIRAKVAKDNETLSDRYNSIIRNLERQKDELKKTLTDHIDKNANAMQDNTKVVTDLQRKIATLEGQVTSTMFDKNELERRLNALVSAYDDENGGYRKLMNSKEKSIHDLQAQVDSATSLLARNQLVLEERVQELSIINEKLSSANASINSLTQRNANLAVDHVRMAALLEMTQGQMTSLDADLKQCNTDRLTRIDQTTYQQSQTMLTACDDDRKNNYVSKGNVGLNYVQRQEHNTLLQQCNDDKRDNYVAKGLLATDYVTRDKYDALDADTKNPQKFLKADYVWSNYISNADFQEQIKEYSNGYVRRAMFENKEREAQSCVADKNNNYVHRDVVSSNYLATSKHAELLQQQQKACDDDKIRNYVTVAQNVVVKDEVQACERDKKDNYVTRKAYEEQVSATRTCESDRSTNYIPKVFVENNYKTNQVHMDALVALNQQHAQDTTKNYWAKAYVATNYKTVKEYDDMALEKAQQCAGEKSEMQVEFNKVLENDYWSRSYVANNFVGNNVHQGVVNQLDMTQTDLGSLQTTVSTMNAEMSKFNNAANMALTINGQTVKMNDIVSSAGQGRCGPQFYGLQCPTDKSCNQFGRCV